MRLKDLLLGRKAITNPDSTLKSRDITLPTKVWIVKVNFFFFFVQIWELDYIEGWVPKNWCFPTVVLDKTLENPLGSKEIKPVSSKGNQSWILLEGLILKVKLQYFGHLIWRTDSLKRPWCWERLNAGGEGDDRGWDGCMVSLTPWTWVWVNSGSWWWTGSPFVL